MLHFGRDIPRGAARAVEAAQHFIGKTRGAWVVLSEICSLTSDDPRAMVARLPTIVAAFWRLRQGAEPLDPRADLGHAANFLYMLSGDVPDPERVRGLETYLDTVVDHGFNASTFTARVITSTGSDLVSAVVGAIGALKSSRTVQAAERQLAWGSAECQCGQLGSASAPPTSIDHCCVKPLAFDA